MRTGRPPQAAGRACEHGVEQEPPTAGSYSTPCSHAPRDFVAAGPSDAQRQRPARPASVLSVPLWQN